MENLRNKKVVSYMPQHLFEELDEYTKREGEDRSTIIRRAIVAMLKKDKVRRALAQSENIEL